MRQLVEVSPWLMDADYVLGPVESQENQLQVKTKNS